MPAPTTPSGVVRRERRVPPARATGRRPRGDRDGTALPERGSVRTPRLDGRKPTVEFVHRPETGTPLRNDEGGERVNRISDRVVQTLRGYISSPRKTVTDDEGRRPLVSTAQGRVAPSSGNRLQVDQAVPDRRRVSPRRRPGDVRVDVVQHGVQVPLDSVTARSPESSNHEVPRRGDRSRDRFRSTRRLEPDSRQALRPRIEARERRSPVVGNPAVLTDLETLKVAASAVVKIRRARFSTSRHRRPYSGRFRGPSTVQRRLISTRDGSRRSRKAFGERDWLRSSYNHRSESLIENGDRVLDSRFNTRLDRREMLLVAASGSEISAEHEANEG